MDRKSMEASHVVDQMTEQHFDGGFFSDDVRQKFETIRGLSAEEKKVLYKDSFERAYTLASEFAKNDAYTDEHLNLTEHGLGKIHISFYTMSKDELIKEGFDDLAGYRMLTVYPVAFNPRADAYTAYDDNDMLGSGNPHLAYHQKHPKYWEDGQHISLDDNGDVDDNLDLDTNILLALDIIETLEIARTTLTSSPSELDFTHLEERAAAYEKLDTDLLNELQSAYRLHPPAPYDKMFKINALKPTQEHLREVMQHIDTNDALLPEQKHILHSELFERWQAAVVGQSGEGFNN